MALDIDERHLLRLGHGEEALETEKDFSRYGTNIAIIHSEHEFLQNMSKEYLGPSLGPCFPPLVDTVVLTTWVSYCN